MHKLHIDQDWILSQHGEEKYMKVLSIGKRYGADGIVPRLYNMDIYNLISIYQNDVLHGVRI